jgi:anti-sigma regulatory factor (Ser/Thr protein kinase)
VAAPVFKEYRRILRHGADAYSVAANAVRHARSDGARVTLTVYADDRTMRVEVGDGGPGFEPELLRPPDTDRSGGWGIPMVAAPIGGVSKRESKRRCGSRSTARPARRRSIVSQ